MTISAIHPLPLNLPSKMFKKKQPKKKKTPHHTWQNLIQTKSFHSNKPVRRRSLLLSDSPCVTSSITNEG